VTFEELVVVIKKHWGYFLAAMIIVGPTTYLIIDEDYTKEISSLNQRIKDLKERVEALEQFQERSSRFQEIEPNQIGFKKEDLYDPSN